MSHSVPICPNKYRKCPRMIYNVLECNFSTEDAVLLLRMQYKFWGCRRQKLRFLMSHSVPTCPKEALECCEYIQTTEDAWGCTRMHEDAQGCMRMYKDVQGCTRMYKDAQGCTRMQFSRCRKVVVKCSTSRPNFGLSWPDFGFSLQLLHKYARGPAEKNIKI